MKTFITTSILILVCQVVMAQGNPAKKDFYFVDPATKKQMKLTIGNKVYIRFKSPDVKTNGTILAVTDSTLTLALESEPYRQIIPFSNVANMSAPAFVEVRKRYMVRITLTSGELRKGELVRITQDSLTLLKGKLVIQTAASEIKSILIRRKKEFGRALYLGAAAGGVIGGVIGYASYKPDYSFLGIEYIDRAEHGLEGAVIGAFAGVVVGAIVGSAGIKRFNIGGNQTQFEMFSSQYIHSVYYPGKSKLERTKD